MTNIRWMIDRGMFRIAEKRLESALLKKVDGCTDAGSPDGNDWLVNCNRQKRVYWALHEILVLLKTVT